MKTDKSMKRTIALASAVAASIVFDACAVRSEGGEFNYGGSVTDMRTTGQTGDQIWNVTSPLNIQNFWPGQTDNSPYWQIYRGESITDSGQCHVERGNVVFENAVKWAGTHNYIGTTGPTKLVLRNGGSLTVTKEHLRIGQANPATATVFLEEQSALKMLGGNLIAGNQRPGAIWMDGGTMVVSNGIFKTGSTPSQDGYIRINGGEVSIGNASGDIMNIGSANNYGSLHISGGRLFSRRSSPSNAMYAKLGINDSQATDIYIDGGLFDLWNERFGIGYWGNYQNGRATFTVDGDGRAIVYLTFIATKGSGNTGRINLNGGRFECSSGFNNHYILDGTTTDQGENTGNSRGVNFDGGTLALVRDSRSPAAVGKLGPSAGNIVVYPKGGTIDVPSGIDGVVSAATFRKATGWGVSAITLTNPGSGYVTAPKVTISGGSGSGATAYAIMNNDRTINRIVVTCRGEGYAAGDSVTVAISSATGSGATATATLASNAGGVLRKTGSGTWHQQTRDNNFDGEIEFAEGALKLDGAGFPSVSALRMGEGVALNPVKGKTSSLNRLDAKNGIVDIHGEGTGTATLNIGALSVNQGLALVTYTNGLNLALAATDSTATSSSSSPVVNGLVYANKDRPSNDYRTPSLYERAADGSLSLVTTASTPGADANWMPTASISAENAPEVSALNSIIMPLGANQGLDCYVKNSGNIEVKSGMMVVRRPNEGIQRMQVTGGGAFTTRAKDGFFIYGDTKEAGRRSNSQANGNVVFYNQLRRLFGPFADPDGSTPMALTIAGEKQSRPELGAQAWLLGVQTFSGGLNLVNGGVFIQADSGLGASGSPVRASGYCSIAAYNYVFKISHPIQLLDGSALIFSPQAGNQGNEVSGALSGSGDLLTSDVNRGGYAMAFTGDHSAFTGDYYIQGHARIAPATFAANAGIKLADGTNGVGVIETSGSFSRPAGTGKGEVCWKTHIAYASDPNIDYGLRGGFAALGGGLTVNLGGNGAKLVAGADYLPDGAVIQLQSQYANGALAFANGFELDGKTQKVNVWSGKTATLSGAVSDEVGGGVLAVTGNLNFAGTLEVSAANIAAGETNIEAVAAMMTVDGDLSFSQNSTVRLPDSVTPESLDAFMVNGLPLFRVTGRVTGCPGNLVAAGLDGSWEIRVKKHGVVSLVKQQGMTIFIK